MSDPVNYFSPDGILQEFSSPVCTSRQTNLMKLSNNKKNLTGIAGTCENNTTIAQYLNNFDSGSGSFYVCQLTNTSDTYIAGGLLHSTRSGLSESAKTQCQNLASKQTGTWTPKLCDSSKSLTRKNRWECSEVSSNDSTAN